MCRRWLVEVLTSHWKGQKGGQVDFECGMMLRWASLSCSNCWSAEIFTLAQPPPGLTENSPKKRKNLHWTAVVFRRTNLCQGVKGQNTQTGWRPQKGNSNSDKILVTNKVCRILSLKTSKLSGTLTSTLCATVQNYLPQHKDKMHKLELQLYFGVVELSRSL